MTLRAEWVGLQFPICSARYFQELSALQADEASGDSKADSRASQLRVFDAPAPTRTFRVFERRLFLTELRSVSCKVMRAARITPLGKVGGDEVISVGALRDILQSIRGQQSNPRNIERVRWGEIGLVQALRRRAHRGGSPGREPLKPHLGLTAPEVVALISEFQALACKAFRPGHFAASSL